MSSRSLENTIREIMRGPITEQVVVEGHFKVGDEVIYKGQEGEVVKLDTPQTGKYYNVKLEDGKMIKASSDELKLEDEEEEEDEDDNEEEKMNEKAVSQAQQKAAGIALAAKRGDIPNSQLQPSSKAMMGMSTKDLEKYAKTKHKGLPTRKEEVELDEAVTVKKQNYSWGKMMTVHHGNETSYPLHPEHQAKIKALGDGQKTSFKDETKRTVIAHRDGDTIHLSGAGTSKKTAVKRSHFTEQVDKGEYDYEGDMAKTQLNTMMDAAKELRGMLKDDENMPEWVQSKITKAADYLDSARDYMKNRNMKPTEEQANGGASKKKEDEFHSKLDRLMHKTFGHSPDEKKMKKEEIQMDEAEIRGAERKDKEFVVKFENPSGGGVKLRAYMAKSDLDAESKAKVDARRMGMRVASVRLKEDIDLEESIGSVVGGGIGQFVGNKIDPLHGEIMRTHGAAAGRAAEYTIRKHLHNLHKALKKHLSSGTANEEVELDEASTAERKERNAAINNVHKGFYDKASKSKLKKVSKIGSDTYFIKSRSIYDPHESHFKTASGKYGSTMHSSEGGVPSHQEIHKDIKDHNPHLSKDEVKSAANVIHAHMSKHRLGEEVELDEGKYGAFRTGPKRPKYPYVPPGNQDPRTGLPLGFSPPPNKDEPKDKKVKEEVELSEGMSHSELADHHFNLAKKYYKKSDALENSGNSYDADHFSEVADAHATAHHLHKQAATSGNAKDSKAAHAASREANDYNVNEQVELDELDQKTLSNYATRAKFSSDPERRKGAAKAQEKIDKKSKDMQKKEAEQVDEALRHEIAGQVAAFLGNKIDPLHGQIMHVHGKEAYRQAATHIRRVAGEVHDAVSALHDKLHKHLRTGGITTEEVELDESHFKVGDKVKCKASGMKGEVVKLDKEEGGDTEKYYTVKREDGTTKKMAPKDMTKINEETDQIDEVSAGLAKSVAQRRDQDFRKMTPTETQKRRMGRGDWRADPSLQADKAYKSAVKRGAKDVYGYKEETELDEDGKLKGGAKDPCWTGYKMVGTKKKGGREVPNCVPREGTEQNTFKALREKLNGNSNRS